MSNKTGLDRRSFIKNSALGLFGGGIVSPKTYAHAQHMPASDNPRIKEYRTLGRTGFKVSDLGGGHVGDEGLLRAFLDAGVNYIDSSEGYRYNQRVIGSAMKSLDRKSIFITSKVLANTSYNHISQSDITKEGFLKRAYRILESLQTDYLDCLMISGPTTVEMLKNDAFHAATRQLKKEDRLRHVGVSHHGSQYWGINTQDPMEKILLAAAEDGRFDVMLLAYNFLKEDKSEHILEVCSQKKIGTTLMKVNPVRTYNEMKAWLDKRGPKIEKKQRQELQADFAKLQKKVDNAQEFIRRYDLKSDKEIRNAAIRFVLSNPNVHTVCYTLQNYTEAQEFLKLSGSRLNSQDSELLKAYSQECGSLYCRHACGLCEPACPHQVPVNTIMRYDHYFVAQGREKHAIEKYAGLRSNKAEVCQNCSGYCESACPYGVPVQTLLASAHQTLSMA